MNLDLSGKTALVSGGARGIGAAISRGLCAAGAKVVINFNRSGEKAEKIRDELRSEGFEAEIFQADVSEPAQVDRLFEFIKSSAGQLDILVNNAGVIRDTSNCVAIIRRGRMRTGNCSGLDRSAIQSQCAPWSSAIPRSTE